MLNGRMGQDGGRDWATKGEGPGAWIQLDLVAPTRVSLIKFAGHVRDSKFRHVKLNFSDGSQVYSCTKSSYAKIVKKYNV